jgi:iron complex outermembrane receptor protein
LINRRLILSFAAAGTWLVACPVHSQNAPAATAASSDSLGEIVVTAQRREQRLQDVPIAVQVLSTDAIQKHAADDIGDMQKWVPGLVVTSDSPTQPHYGLRGIVSSDFGVGTDPQVGVYVDGVYAARSGASFLAFDDVERIEVLKGPQGTLLGRSSAAGAISIVTKKPTDEYEGSLDLRFGNEGKERYEGMLNVPLAAGMAMRFNFVANRADGFLTDAVTGQELNPEKNYAGRVAFRWDIDADTRLLLSWNHDEINQLSRPAIGLIAAPPGGFVEGTLPPYPPDPTGASFLNPLTAPIYNDEVGNREDRNFNDFMMSYERRFGDVTFSSTTDWRQFRTSNLESETGTDGFATYFDTDNIEHNAAWYQEFKLSGKSKIADWVAGASYSYEHAQQTSAAHTYTDAIDTLFTNLCLAGPPCSGVYGPYSQGLAQAGIPISLLGLPWEEDMIDDGRFKSLGVFGDVIWHLTDSLDFTTGVRYSHDTKDFTWLAPPRSAPQLDAYIAQLAQLGVTVPPIPNLIFSEPGLQGAPFTASGSWSDVSPRAVLEYKLNPSAMVYASVAKGFTPGGFDAVQINGKYANEDVWNYELGFKTLFPDAHLLVNGSVYYYSYKNKQSLVLTSVPGSSVPEYTVSSSDQKATGVDLDVRWQPFGALTLGVTAAYIDSTYTQYESPSLLTEGQALGLNGAPLQSFANLSGQPTGEPTWSYAASADYVVRLADGDSVDLFVAQSYRGATRCNGESQVTYVCLPQASFPLGVAQTQTDAKLTWRNSTGKWGWALYGTNVFDHRYVTGIDNITASTFGTPQASVNAPRRYGVDVHVAF